MRAAARAEGSFCSRLVTWPGRAAPAHHDAAPDDGQLEVALAALEAAVGLSAKHAPISSLYGSRPAERAAKRWRPSTAAAGRARLAEVASDHQRSAELGKRVSELGEAVRLYEEWTPQRPRPTQAGRLLKDASGEDEDFLATTLAEAEATLPSRRGEAARDPQRRAIRATTGR